VSTEKISSFQSFFRKLYQVLIFLCPQWGQICIEKKLVNPIQDGQFFFFKLCPSGFVTLGFLFQNCTTVPNVDAVIKFPPWGTLRYSQFHLGCESKFLQSPKLKAQSSKQFRFSKSHLVVASLHTRFFWDGEMRLRKTKISPHETFCGWWDANGEKEIALSLDLRASSFGETSTRNASKTGCTNLTN